MTKEFDQRYIDVEDTPRDILVGGGELAVPLSQIRRAINAGGGSAGGLVDEVTGQHYKLGMSDGKLFVEDVEE